MISFTSGNTGEPKAAIRTHGLLRSQHRAIEQNLALEVRSEDVLLVWGKFLKVTTVGVQVNFLGEPEETTLRLGVAL